jgi:hypothetical protein
MKKIALFIPALLVPVTGILAASPLIAFEHNNAVWIANLDGAGVRKIGCWIDDENILFLSRAAREKEDSIYRMSTDGKDLKRLISDARFPSVSTP